MKKIIIIISVLLATFLLALPSFFPKVPVIIIPQEDYKREFYDLITQNVSVEENLVSGEYHIEFQTISDQISASKKLKSVYGEMDFMQLSLKDRELSFLPNIELFKPIGFGLDLSGGVFLSFSINTESLVNSYISKISETYEQDSKIEDIKTQLYDTLASVRETEEGFEFYLEGENKRKLISQSITQIISVIESRINEIGISSSSVYREGDNNIVVEMPGIQDIEKAKNIIGSTSTVEFRLEKSRGKGSEVILDSAGIPYFLSKTPKVDGKSIISAVARLDRETGTPKVSVSLDIEGGKVMKSMTSKNIGEPMMTVLIEKFSKRGEIITSKKVINAASIGEELSTRFEITGIDSMERAQDLALFLRTGNFVTPITIENEQVIAPSLGESNVKTSFKSMAIGVFIVFIILFFRYGAIYGLIANTAMLITLFIIIFILSQVGASLTLAGVAGLLLTVGMSVDSSVIIFEKVRRSTASSINELVASFNQAKESILDANITTVFAAIMLYMFGNTTIKAFSVTLIIGIFVSLLVTFLYIRPLIFNFSKKTDN